MVIEAGVPKKKKGVPAIEAGVPKKKKNLLWSLGLKLVIIEGDSLNIAEVLQNQGTIS